MGRQADRDGLTAVKGEAEVLMLLDHLLDPERSEAAIGIAQPADALSMRGLRSVIGAGPRIFHVHNRWLEVLARALGRHALPVEMIKIWWPGLTPASEPGDHPWFVAVADENPECLLEEFARIFYLSRPVVRREVRQLEELRSIAERELAKSKHRLHIEGETKARSTCHRATRPAKRRRH
jgi:hypothetical protein